MNNLLKRWTVGCVAVLSLGAAMVIGLGIGQEKPDAEPSERPTVRLTAATRSVTPTGVPPSDAPPAKLLGETTPSEKVTEAAYAGPSDSVRSVTFDDIKFDMKKDEKFRKRMLTDKINGLFEKSIKIRGYILPSFKQSGITRFVLVRDNMECCFGPGAALYDCIIVDMVEGKSTKYTVRPVTVEGKFSFETLEDPIDGTLRAIYHLDGVSVR